MTSSQSASAPAGERDKKFENKYIEDVNLEGQRIYDDYRRRAADDPQFMQLSEQARYEYYMKQYPDFARSQPIILRYIASFGMFNRLANFLYFKRCFEVPVKTNEDYCSHQAEFVSWLYMYERGVRGEALEKLKKKVYKHLLKEVKDYEREKETIRAQRAATHAQNDAIRREAIKKRIQDFVGQHKSQTDE